MDGFTKDEPKALKADKWCERRPQHITSPTQFYSCRLRDRIRD